MTGTVTYSCGGCANRWPGVSRCHCSECHHTFSGLETFDRHRRNGCVDPATILTRDGYQAMFLTNGLWQGVEDPAPRKPPRKT